jgi:diadenosine tetraphosphate (Ap4A) HIT family hydrolase|tara:strand:+ start:78 stop:452 length:375 start_codon:yes stop_codon:yes gene_type:complete
MTNDSPFFDDREHIFENSVGFVILDRYPVSEGHCLIVSKRVYSNYFDSSEEEIIGLNELLFQTKTFLDKKFKPSGYNVGINCGEVSGQTVDHLHIHIIPRYPNDVDDPTGGVRGVIPHRQKYDS